MADKNNINNNTTNSHFTLKTMGVLLLTCAACVIVLGLFTAKALQRYRLESVSLKSSPAIPVVYTTPESKPEPLYSALQAILGNDLAHILGSAIEFVGPSDQEAIKSLLYSLDYMTASQETPDIAPLLQISRWDQEFYVDGSRLWSDLRITVLRSAFNESRVQMFPLLVETGVEAQSIDWLVDRLDISVSNTPISKDVMALNLSALVSNGDNSETQNKWVLRIPLIDTSFVGDTLRVYIKYGSQKYPFTQNIDYSLWSELGAAYYPNGITHMNIAMHVADGIVGPGKLQGLTPLDNWHIQPDCRQGLVTELSQRRKANTHLWLKRTGITPINEGYVSMSFQNVSRSTQFPLYSFSQASMQK